MDVAIRRGQGGREYMQDFAHVERDFGGRSGRLYVGVFDGHSGDSVAHAASERLHGLLAKELESGRTERDAIRAAFHAFDEEVADEPCGSTAAVAILEGSRLVVGNAGDTHIALVSGIRTAIVTADHRLTNPREHERVLAAGARIWGPYVCLPDGRGLMPTRAVGDREFRAVGVIAEPDVAEVRLGPEDGWVVAGTDGVWDEATPEEVGTLVREAQTAAGAADVVARTALARGTDNVTFVAVRRT